MSFRKRKTVDRFVPEDFKANKKTKQKMIKQAAKDTHDIKGGTITKTSISRVNFQFPATDGWRSGPALSIWSVNNNKNNTERQETTTDEDDNGDDNHEFSVSYINNFSV